MAQRDPTRSRGMYATWMAFAAVTLAVPAARAQQRPTRPRPPQPAYRTYQRPPIIRPVARPLTRPPMQPGIARSTPVRPMTYAQPMPVRRPRLQIIAPGTATVRTSIAPQLFAARPFAPHTFAQPALPARGFRPRNTWIGARGYSNSFLLGGWPVNAYGYWQVASNFQMLPLGFGMWPACDSASIPGRFWSTGPCFGAGDYQSLAPNYQNQLLAESAPQYYQPLEIIMQPETGQPTAKAQPTQPENKLNMVVCLTNGNETEVSDWWVTGGKFSFVPINGTSNGAVGGKIQTVDLDSLDLQKTIEENERRGRTFILNFTPPDQRPTSPPSNP